MDELPINPEPKPETEPKTSPVRPVLLTVLCFLTFIWSGLSFISYLMVAAFYSTFKVLMESAVKTMKLPGLDLMLSAKPSFYLVSGLFYLVSATGAVQMWKLKKNGFHIYTIAQILLIIAPMYFLRLPGPSIADLLLSGSFILLYSLNLKYMS